MKCAVGKCKQSNSKKTTVSFYNFPKDAAQRKSWVKFCNRWKPINLQKEKICALHFKQEDFERNMQFEMGYSNRRAPKLKAGAVPTIDSSATANVFKIPNEMTDIKEVSSQQYIETLEMKMFLPTKMNLNYDTFIKQELLNEDEEDLLTTLPSSNLNIPVKNEPISDDISPLVTIKNEPFLEESLIKEGVTVKTENQVTSSPGDSFIIYELETPPPTTRTLPTQILQNDKQIITKSTQMSPQMQALTIPQHNQLAINTIPAVKTHLQHIPISNKTVPAVRSSPPILLNSQFRKRHNVVPPVNPIHKRTRYNIEGTTTESLATVITDPMSSPTTLNKCRLLNTGSKRIINHLIKSKRNKSQHEESPKIIDNSLTQESTEKSNPIIEEPTIIEPQIDQATAITTQTEVNPSASYSLITPLKTENLLILPKESKNPPFIPELRVKCLCSLTANSVDTSTDTSELKTFFQEMFEETRRLSKKQQRQVKMTLLQAVSDGEELMEQGKCCGF